MRGECGGGYTSADGICKIVHFSLNVDDLQIYTQDFLSHSKEFCKPSHVFVGGQEFSVPAVGGCVVTAALQYWLPSEFHMMVFEGYRSGEEVDY